MKYDSLDWIFGIILGISFVVFMCILSKEQQKIETPIKEIRYKLPVDFKSPLSSCIINQEFQLLYMTNENTYNLALYGGDYKLQHILILEKR